MDKFIKILEQILEKVENLEDLTKMNNSLIGFIISEKNSNPFSEQKYKSVLLTAEMLDYMQTNNIPMDFLGDA